MNHRECDRYRNSLTRLIDGEGTEAEREGAQAHADRCPDCRETVASARALKNLLGRAPAATPPSGRAALEDRILAAVDDDDRRHVLLQAGATARLLTAAAALLMVALLTWNFTEGRTILAPADQPSAMAEAFLPTVGDDGTELDAPQEAWLLRALSSADER